MQVRASTFPYPEEHAAALLEALGGNCQKALEYMPVYRDEFGETPSFNRPLSCALPLDRDKSHYSHAWDSKLC